MNASVVGIDVGTSSCSVACMIDGVPTVLPAFAGHDEMPTYVAFTSDGERLVGWAAKRQVVTNASNTIFTIKRLIGRKFASAATQAELGLLPYRVIPSVTGGLWVEARGRSYSPTEITAIMLGEVRRAATEYLGREVKQAVITVPAYFDSSQRQATKNAAKIAGLEPLRLVAEPTAAALAYGFGRENDKGRTVAVYDLGGGTFDISILVIGDGVFEVKSISGDNRLGGEDFDHALVGHFIETLKWDQGVDVSKDHLALHRLKDVAERFKVQLDTVRTVEETLPYLTLVNGHPFHANLKLSRDVLERLFSKLIERTLGPCQKAIYDAGVRPDALILVGGMSRMPLVQKRVGEFFKLVPERHHDPSRAVAQGAAIEAGTLAGDVKNVLLLDVVSLSIGIADPMGRYFEIIEKNTTIPTKKGFHFSIDNETKKCLVRSVDSSIGEPIEFDLMGLMHSGTIKIIEQIGSGYDKSIILGDLHIDFGPLHGTIPSLQVTFDLDANGSLRVTALNDRTGKSFTKRLLEIIDPFDPATRLDPEYAVGFTEEDMARARAQADELLTAVDAKLRSGIEDFRPELIGKISEAQDALRRAMQNRDPIELGGSLAAFCKVTNLKLPAGSLLAASGAKPVELSAVSEGRSIFISYAREDLDWLERIRVHLMQLERLGHVEIWHDGKIAAGAPWQEEIEKALRKATAAVLLVSANFMASSFIYDFELPPILERNRADGLSVFPVFVGHCYFQRDPVLSRLNAFNDPRAPLKAMSDSDVEASLARLVEKLWACLDQSRLH
jgi:molecular chaperone DnaK